MWWIVECQVDYMVEGHGSQFLQALRVTGGRLLVWVVKWYYCVYHHWVGCSVGKVFGLWEWLAW
jgi:hypothetical protein